MEDLAAPPRPSRWRWRLLSAIVALTVVAGLVWFAYQWGEDGAAGLIDAPGPGSAATDEVPAELDPLIELYQELRTDAVDPPSPDVLVEGAKRGMLEALEDPYARYYDEQQYAAFNEELDGVYSGVGMELEETADGLFVVTVFPGTPAEGAGLRPGDRIVGVDGEDVRDESIELVVRQIRGEEGTEVVIDIERDGAEERYEIVRASIAIPRIEAELLDDGIGYVRLYQFTNGAGDDVRAEVAALVERGADGIVLDLRGNPGGLLREAVQVASVFLRDEVVVRVVERGAEEEVLRSGDEAYADTPLVVLVNEGTASASEIVAGAIQDTERGEIIGEATFGKGTVQTITSLPDGTGAKFTTAEYLTPAGTSIEGVGVQPDEVVAGEEEQLSAAREALRSLMARVPG